MIFVIVWSDNMGKISVKQVKSARKIFFNAELKNGLLSPFANSKITLTQRWWGLTIATYSLLSVLSTFQFLTISDVINEQAQDICTLSWRRADRHRRSNRLQAYAWGKKKHAHTLDELILFISLCKYMLHELSLPPVLKRALCWISWCIVCKEPVNLWVHAGLSGTSLKYKAHALSV